MNWRELLGFSLGAIKSHPMRSALTALGVVIGVAAVVIMTSIGVGAQQKVMASIQSLGTSLLIITPNNRGPGGWANAGAGQGLDLTDEDGLAIKSEVGNVVAESGIVRGGKQVIAGGANWQTSIIGADTDYLTVRDWSLASGRMFEADENKQEKKVALLGQTVVDNLFPDGSNPVGQRIRLGSVPFDVIGVLASKGQSAGGQDQDDVIIVPIKAARSRLFGNRFKASSVQSLYVKASDDKALYRVQDDITNLLRDRHKIEAGKDDDFQVQNMASIMQAGEAAAQTFTFLLAAVAGVSLLVGGVGIMNIMLVSVTERTREIGLRMAIGAKREQILAQFALEAMTLSLGGGLIGLAIGLLGTFLVAKFGDMPAAVPIWATPLSLGFSLFVGLVFGIYPAMRASQLDPIEALRRD